MPGEVLVEKKRVVNQKMSRAIRTRLGQETCARILSRLSKFGEVHNSEGSWGKPDIILEVGKQIFAVESKRCKGVRYKHAVAVVTIGRNEWEYLGRWCADNGGKPIVVVELVLAQRGNLYFVLDTEIVQEKFDNNKGETCFVFSMWQVIDLGKKLSHYFSRLPQKR